MDKFWKCLRFVSCSTVKERKEESEEVLQMSWFGLEVLSRIDVCLAQLSFLEDQPLISENSPWADQMVDKIQSCKSGLRFLRMFFLSLSMLDDTDARIRHVILVQITHEYMETPLAFPPLADRKHVIENWILDLQGRIQNYSCDQNDEQEEEIEVHHFVS